MGTNDIQNHKSRFFNSNAWFIIPSDLLLCRLHQKYLSFCTESTNSEQASNSENKHKKNDLLYSSWIVLYAQKDFKRQKRLSKLETGFTSCGNDTKEIIDAL